MRIVSFILIASCLLVSCQESLEDRCSREAKAYTEKKCPAPIGENMVIDSMSFDRSTHTLHYFYTLGGDPAGLKLLDVRNLLLEQIKNSTSVKEYKEAGYNFAYTYRSANGQGEILFDETFTEKDYRQ